MSPKPRNRRNGDQDIALADQQRRALMQEATAMIAANRLAAIRRVKQLLAETTPTTATGEPSPAYVALVRLAIQVGEPAQRVEEARIDDGKVTITVRRVFNAPGTLAVGPTEDD